ncbi:uncharacterized protein LOC110637782 isoform X1 [Hevea brasiliensis]|uniref:uncharacterized protein LOC110637782 isoform X1 n=1 Tax=Hevea brasiliensis TaxID=3981 RepID=UPI0025DB1A72|nr:uncharacterized protein LOC110637782 isoform X1 [Hevea brasiliensis]XP_058002189.1 uncharacterized protein LOC110637782 isoform X1 [Hevea brasiliensis]
MDVDVFCFVCGIDPESADHLFASYPPVSRLWYVSPLRIHLANLGLSSGTQLFHPVLANFDSDAMELFVILAWGIWKARHQLIFLNLHFNALRIITSCISLRNEYLDVACTSHSDHQEVNTTTNWSFPSPQCYNLNTDASVSSLGVVGLRAVIRNDKGEVMVASVKSIFANWDPTLAEIHAIKFGLDLAIQTGFSNLQVESDALGTVDALRGSQLISPLHSLHVGDVLYVAYSFVNLIRINM